MLEQSVVVELAYHVSMVTVGHPLECRINKNGLDMFGTEDENHK